MPTAVGVVLLVGEFVPLSVLSKQGMGQRRHGIDPELIVAGHIGYIGRA